jgi:hypothetical protein
MLLARPSKNVFRQHRSWADVQAIDDMIGKVVKSGRKHCAELPTACAGTLETKA